MINRLICQKNKLTCECGHNDFYIIKKDQEETDLNNEDIPIWYIKCGGCDSIEQRHMISKIHIFK